MPVPTDPRVGEVYDATPDFVYAVSLLAALEGATGHDGHAVVLPFLGMARAELTDFGQRRNAYYLEVEVGELRSGIAGLEKRVTALLVTSEELQQTLRVDAALAHVRRGITPRSATEDGGMKRYVLRLSYRFIPEKPGMLENPQHAGLDLSAQW